MVNLNNVNLKKSKDLEISMCVLVALIFILSIMFFSISATTTTSAEELTNSNIEWNEFKVDIHNNINDYVFSMRAYSKLDTTNNSYKVRIYSDDIQNNYKYFQIVGYTFYQFTGFTAGINNSFYESEWNTIQNAYVIAQYTANTYTITFIDSYTDTQIGIAYTVSAGVDVKAPTAPEHVGYVFVGWQGGDYNNVNRSAAIYAVYAPERTVKVIYSNGDEEVIKVAVGTTQDELESKLGYDGKKFFKCFSSSKSSSDKISAESVINQDVTLYALYTSTGHGKLFGIMWYWFLAAAAVIAIVTLILCNR